MSSVSSSTKQNRDRISNLPDNLITHILSFLSTKDAVKTSALSTSWNQQWTLVPVISLTHETRIGSGRFVNFAYRVLRHKVAPLELFRLSCRDSDAINVSDWIFIALSRHAREIDVQTSFYSPTPLPDSLYSSKTLVSLKLDGDFVFEVPDKISLESLKILHYQVLKFEGGESFSRLISSCPVLEELQIIGELVENVKVLNISSLVLKRLILTDLNSEIGPSHRYELVLNTPNLQYLEIKDQYGVPDRYHINTLHCLDIARLSFYLDDYEFHKCIPARPFADLVVAISNVQVLYISETSFEKLYFNKLHSTALPDFELPKFYRLIRLELGRIYLDVGLRLLIAFLQSSPQLEYLYFYLDCEAGAWYPPTDVPFCMIYNIKVIKVDFSDEQELVLNVLTYFLEKTNCLEELIILHPEEKDEEFLKIVSMLPRASNSCKISLT